LIFFHARDFWVVKGAVAGALAKFKTNSSASLAAVEQEQIRNFYRKADVSYSVFMSRQCSFGPIKHIACSGVYVFARFFFSGSPSFYLLAVIFYSHVFMTFCVCGPLV
jgi:hypothetical protein